MARAGGKDALQLIGDMADRALERVLGGLVARALWAQQGRRSVSLDRKSPLPAQTAAPARAERPRSFTGASISVAGVEPRGLR